MDTKAAKHKEQRVGVFVDGSNMYHSSQSLYQTNVNFGKILEQAVANRKLVRAMAYVIKSSAQDEQPFFDALEKQGFEVKSKDLQVFSSGAKKGDWDVGIAIDTIKLSSHLDVVVLVSGDGDFATLVQYLQMTMGCRVEVMAFGESASLKLREVDYIQAAHALGVSHVSVMARHILPNVMHIVLITVVLDFSGLVLAEAVLSYVGVGVDPTMDSWGNMINSARLEMAREPIVWWSLVSAFVFMFGLVLSANLFSDAVRDAFDPRLRR